MDDDELLELVGRAQAGDARALQELVHAVQDDVFGLAMRMLGYLEDVRDAS
jgi:DNA-directed RNA polymerase specialized sigma24 family protein